MALRRNSAIAICAVSITLSLIGAAGLGIWYWSVEEAANPSPSPLSVEDKDASPLDEIDGFVDVDWNYWSSFSPAIIGWVNVPETSINHPIVQAPENDPTFYLEHSAAGEYNPMGCPYLDSGCAEDGFESRNAVIFGHHWEGGRVFSDFANYSDSEFAETHRNIYLQTPRIKKMLEVESVAVVRGTEETKQVLFDSSSDFRCWFWQRYSESRVKLSNYDSKDELPASITTFCTCSYFFSSNERTLVYAKEKSRKNQRVSI